MPQEINLHCNCGYIFKNISHSDSDSEILCPLCDNQYAIKCEWLNNALIWELAKLSNDYQFRIIKNPINHSIFYD